MSKPLFLPGTNGRGTKPSDWRGWVLLSFPLLLGVFGVYMRQTTGNNSYELIEIIAAVIGITMAWYLLRRSPS